MTQTNKLDFNQNNNNNHKTTQKTIKLHFYDHHQTILKIKLIKSKYFKLVFKVVSLNEKNILLNI